MGNHFVDAVLSSGRDEAVFLSDLGGGRMSYADMRRRAGQVSNALVGLGVAPGDRVAAQIDKSVDGLLLALGTIQAGAAFLPLNTAYTPREVAYFLGDAEPRVVVCDPAVADAIRPMAACLETLDAAGRGSLRGEIDAAATAFSPVERGPDDLAAVIYTSGTTGRAKGAMVTHGNLISNARTLAELWRFNTDDRLLHALPIYHTHGLFTAVCTVLVAGASLIFLPKFDADAILRAMPGASAMMGVPTFYTRLLDHPSFTREVAGHMRLFISGSAPLLASTHERFAKITGHAVLERYGMTETNMTTSNPYDGERRGGTVGFPLPGIDVRVVEPTDGKSIPTGKVGMIEVRGPNVFKGYWRNPEKTAEAFRPDGYFITGDLGRIDADGYLQISGRGKDLIIVGGLNVYPKEVELAVDALPGVAESAVIGVAHADLGEGVTAVVVAEPGHTLDEAAVLAALHGQLARFKLPKRIVFVGELPRNAMGKVQKNALRETFRDLYGKV